MLPVKTTIDIVSWGKDRNSMFRSSTAILILNKEWFSYHSFVMHGLIRFSLAMSKLDIIIGYEHYQLLSYPLGSRKKIKL